MALSDIKNYLQGLLKAGYGNTSQTPIPTAAFPMDGRTYFESYEKAVAAAELAEAQGSKNTIFYFGMTLVVYENGIVTEYVIVKDDTTGKGKLIEKLNESSCVIIDGGNADAAEAEAIGV